MRSGSLFFLLICSYSSVVAAQDIGQAVMLNQQSLQSMSGNRPSINLHGPQLTANGKPTGNYAVPEANRDWLNCGCSRKPIFPVTAGEISAGTQVTISASPDSAIFYTTDGWTPTEASARYTGPLTVYWETRLQAIAIEPNKLPSTIAEVTYTVTGPYAHKPEDSLATSGILVKDTALRLVTGGAASSETAQVGDRVVLFLDESVMAGGVIVVAKGSPVDATITQVRHAQRSGKPGLLVFQVRSLNVHGIVIPLKATLTLAARDPVADAQRISNPSMIHVVSAPAPGEDAEIEPGMTLTASVDADTPLHPVHGPDHE